jgi:hypothetical protein
VGEKVPLREYVERIVADLDKRIDAIRSEDLRARSLTEGRMTDKFEEHNRFREQINHERGEYVTRVEMNAFKANFSEYKEATSKALQLAEGKSAGVSNTFSIGIAIIGAAGTVVAIIAAILLWR